MFIFFFFTNVYTVQELKGGGGSQLQSDSELELAYSQGGRPLHGVLAQTVPFLFNVGGAKQKTKESGCEDLTNC